MTVWFNNSSELLQMGGSGFAVWVCYSLFVIFLLVFMVPAIKQWRSDNQNANLAKNNLAKNNLAKK